MIMTKLLCYAYVAVLCFVPSHARQKVEFTNSSIRNQLQFGEEGIKLKPEPLKGNRLSKTDITATPTTAATPEANHQKLALSGGNPHQPSEFEITSIQEEKIDISNVCEDQKKKINETCGYCGNTEYYDSESQLCQILDARFEQCAWNHTFGSNDICRKGSCKCYGSDGKAGVCEFGLPTLDHTYANCTGVPRTSTSPFVPIQTTPSTEVPSTLTTARTEISTTAITPATTTTPTSKGTTTTTKIPPTTSKNEIQPLPNENLDTLKYGIVLTIVLLCLIGCYHCYKSKREDKRKEKKDAQPLLPHPT